MKHFSRLISTTLTLLCFSALPAAAGSLYTIRPGTTTIGFSVDHLGMFTTEGNFAQFEGKLLLDLDNPERSRVEVKVDTGSVEVNSAEARQMLLSPDYFDPGQFPQMRFKAVSVEKRDGNKVRITGELTVRGITKPQVLDAELTERRFDPAVGAEVANFVVTGTMERSAFGMDSDEDFVSDDVVLTISAHIQLASTDNATPPPGN
ncbi:polyisoprenoid-binding protein [Oleomonas cavernae]|uniref:Polyisoprenoid-binding protein n=1 Tax=Oleomonas cavernae TaxID=2320859 RepID=A0A418VUC6_9PROT|nr:YceI family protein [Oleomonas cavernae]RJF80762.1 polyisoprenoid-binding protein [Oleomonas cavernae]